MTLDLPAAPSDLVWTKGLTSTQIGAIGEATVAAALTLYSNGRFGLFRPFADDDGLDLLIYDKVTRLSLPIQVKGRRTLDGPTVQFDVRLKTFSSDSGGCLLAVLLDRLNISCCWFIPGHLLPQIATVRPDKLSVVASPAENSRDKFTPFRHRSFEGVIAEIVALFTSRSRP